MFKSDVKHKQTNKADTVIYCHNLMEEDMWLYGWLLRSNCHKSISGLVWRVKIDGLNSKFTHSSMHFVITFLIGKSFLFENRIQF